MEGAELREELSAASLAAAGSLITRREILTKELLKGRSAKAATFAWIESAR